MKTVVASMVLCAALGATPPKSPLTPPAPSDDEIREMLVPESSWGYDFQAARRAMEKRFASRQAFVKRLVSFLGDDSEKVRREVLELLTDYRADAASAVPAVAATLQKDRDVWVRVRAVWALHAILGKDGLKYQSLALKDSSPDVRAAAIQAVASQGASAAWFVPDLQRLLSDKGDYYYSISIDMMGSRPVRYGAVIALGKIGQKARVALPQLRKMMADDPHTEVRVEAAVAIARLDEKDTSSVRYLMKQAKNAPSKHARFDAIWGLNKLEGRAKASAPLLKRLLKTDPSDFVRSAAVMALPEVNGPGQDTVDALIGALNDAELEVQCDALEGLAELGPRAASAVPAVKRALDAYLAVPEDDIAWAVMGNDIRVQAVATLLAIGKPKMVTPIVDEALHKAKTRQLRSKIQQLLKDDRPGDSRKPSGNSGEKQADNPAGRSGDQN